MSFNHPPSRKVQFLSVPMGNWYDWTIPENPFVSENRQRFYTSDFLQNSIGHRKAPDGSYRSGGPWLMMRSMNHYIPSASATVIRADRKLYNGRFIVSQHWGGSAVPNWWNFSNTNMMNDYWNALSAKAVRAYNNAKPTNPSFLGANALFELKDLPNMLKQANKGVIERVRRAWAKKSQNRNMSHTAEWYLALQFGWAPLLDDIRKFVKEQADGQKRLAQLIRDEGKPVKRSSKVENPFGEDDFNGINHWTWVDDRPYSTYMSPTMVTQAYVGPGKTVTEYKSWVETNTWFSGQFRYLLPPGPKDVLWKARMYARIFGLRAPPSVVYNAVPWSWLVDWFTNLGEFIEATEPGVADTLICDYGYLMHRSAWIHTTQANQFVQEGTSIQSKPKEVSAILKTTHEHKMRWPATTFGFGVTGSDLNLKQVSILGALGRSRL